MLKSPKLLLMCSCCVSFRDPVEHEGYPACCSTGPDPQHCSSHFVTLFGYRSILDLRQAEEERYCNTPSVAGVEDEALRELPVEELDDEEEAPKQRKSGKAMKTDNDVSDLLPVSRGNFVCLCPKCNYQVFLFY